MLPDCGMHGHGLEMLESTCTWFPTVVYYWCKFSSQSKMTIIRLLDYKYENKYKSRVIRYLFTTLIYYRLSDASTLLNCATMLSE